MALPRALAEGYGGWCLMVLAMMPPLQGEPIRHVAYAAPWYRRQRAIAAFLAGYLLVWLALGIIVQLAAALAADQLAFAGPSPAAAFALAALWTRHPAGLRARFSCGRTVPLRAVGWRADADCLRFGLLMGKACLLTCWAPMAALALAGHGVGMMLLVAVPLVYERTRLPPRSRAMGYWWAGLSCALLP